MNLIRLADFGGIVRAGSPLPVCCRRKWEASGKTDGRAVLSRRLEASLNRGSRCGEAIDSFVRCDGDEKSTVLSEGLCGMRYGLRFVVRVLLFTRTFALKANERNSALDSMSLWYEDWKRIAGDVLE